MYYYSHTRGQAELSIRFRPPPPPPPTIAQRQRGNRSLFVFEPVSTTTTVITYYIIITTTTTIRTPRDGANIIILIIYLQYYIPSSSTGSSSGVQWKIAFYANPRSPPLAVSLAVIVHCLFFSMSRKPAELLNYIYVCLYKYIILHFQTSADMRIVSLGGAWDFSIREN